MKRRNTKCVFLILALMISICWVSNSFSIGMFYEGIISQKPWVEDRKIRVEINHVKYMLMPGVVIKINGVEPKKPLRKGLPPNIEDLAVGMHVYYKAAGSSVYTILVD